MKCRCQVYKAHPDLGLCRRCHDNRQRRRAARDGWDFNRRLIPCDEVRPHLDALRGAGMGWAAIALASDVTERQLRHINNSGRNVHAATAARLLAVEVPAPIDVTLLGGAMVSSVGASRRLQSLCALGWTMNELHAYMGLGKKNSQLSKIMHGHSPRVLASTARAIDTAWRELQMTVPPDSVAARRARLRAERACWCVPLAWDPETIDDPNAMPDAKVCVWPSARRLQALCRMGFAQKYLAERLDLTPDVISEILRFYSPIEYRLAHRIGELFTELRAVPSDDERLTSRRSAQARSVTARYGWPLPDDLGDIFKKPSKQELSAMNRENNPRADEAKKMFSEGLSKSEIARRMSVNQSTIYSWLRCAA